MCISDTERKMACRCQLTLEDALDQVDAPLKDVVHYHFVLVLELVLYW